MGDRGRLVSSMLSTEASKSTTIILLRHIRDMLTLFTPLTSPGYKVTAVVRNAVSLEWHHNLNVIIGSVLKQSDMDRAFTSSSTPVDAVVVFLNASRTSDMPWANLVVPPRFMADSVSHAVESLRKYSGNSVQRLHIVILSAFGVGDSFEVTPWIFRWMITHTNLGKTFEDHNLACGC
jgi:hypothetical protein